VYLCVLAHVQLFEMWPELMRNLRLGMPATSLFYQLTTGPGTTRMLITYTTLHMPQSVELPASMPCVSVPSNGIIISVYDVLLQVHDVEESIKTMCGARCGPFQVSDHVRMARSQRCVAGVLCFTNGSRHST
jgi:hypothetical protein